MHNSAGKTESKLNNSFQIAVFFSPSGYHDSKQNVSEESSKQMLKSNKNDLGTITA